MSEGYDDWGNPTSRPRHEMPREKGVVGALKFYTTRTFRQYRTLLSTILFTICLLYYFTLRTPAPPPPKPVDWSKFAYVQYVHHHHHHHYHHHRRRENDVSRTEFLSPWVHVDM